jgi:hypothetical protein
VRGRESFHNLIISAVGQGYGTTGQPLDLKHLIDKVELEQDGVTVFSADRFALHLLESYMNANADNVLVNSLVIPLARLGFGNSDWPTDQMDKLFLKIFTKAALAANSGGNPALTVTNLLAQARFDLLPAPAARGSVCSVHTANHTTVTGTNTIENLPVAPCGGSPGWCCIARLKARPSTMPPAKMSSGCACGWAARRSLTHPRNGFCRTVVRPALSPTQRERRRAGIVSGDV